jgi:hypothetical protein
MKRIFVTIAFSLAALGSTIGLEACGTNTQGNKAATTTAPESSNSSKMTNESSDRALKKCSIDKAFVLPAGCNLPFTPRTGLDVDKHCPREGCAKDGSASQAQDLLKNNFCSTSKPVEMSFQSFTALQSVVDTKKTFDYEGTNKALGVDRTGLAKISTVDVRGKPVVLSEGDVITLTGIVKEAKHDDVPLLDPRFHGEGVNCNNDDVEWNDIHIVLLDSGSDECQSVTAEIIPHFRPAVWDRFDSNPKTSPSVSGLPVAGIKVRLTGQLFFDGSHAPCGNPFRKGSDPARRASWEIHPVYKIEVFDGGKVITFEDWASKH